MTQKVCFVIMGFGKKMDYRNSKEVDLDVIYSKVIKQTFSSEFSDYKLIRADEISRSGIIDASMYALLLKADLVIADITTMNENAIYELGVRHALKPFSTIIMMQESEMKAVPFDISHCQILAYKDYGEKLEDNEAAEIVQELKEFVEETEKQKIDSPLYTYLPSVQPPSIDDEQYQQIIGEASNKENVIAKLVNEAVSYRDKSDFKNAISKWQNLTKLIPNNNYVIQQLALVQYKSKHPNETKALEMALDTIKQLNPLSSLDLETLGITGAIYKRLYKVNRNFAYLDEAITYYKKGYSIKADYYNGENYSNCLLLKTEQPGLADEDITYLKYESKMVCNIIITKLRENIATGEINFWMYGTLANAYYKVGDLENYEKYEKIFLDATKEWEQKTYFETLDDLKRILHR